MIWATGLLLCLGVYRLQVAAADFKPDQVVEDLSIATFDGTFRFGSPGEHRPAVVVAISLDDASSRWMWQDAKSKQDFVTKLPAVDCLFIAYSDDAVDVMTQREHELRKAAQAANMTDASRAELFDRLHFAVDPVSNQPGWLPELLQAWPSSKHVIRADIPGAKALTMERLDPAFEWLPWPGPRSPVPVALVPHDPCQDPWGSSMAGHAALVIPEGLAEAPSPQSNGIGGQHCSYARIIQLAQAAKATAVLIASHPGHDIVQMDCKGPAECSMPLMTPATMISYSDAAEMRDIIKNAASSDSSVAITFADEEVPGYYAAVDEEGRLQEVGWQKFPTLMHVVWEAQWLVYMQQLRQRLAAPALTVPVFQDVVMHGEHGTAAEVVLPDEVFSGHYDSLHLDFALGCPGSRDVDCPIWDHVVQLFVCCDDPGGDACDPCPTTVWAAPSGHLSADLLGPDENAAWPTPSLDGSLPASHMPFEPVWQRQYQDMLERNESTPRNSKSRQLSADGFAAAQQRQLQSSDVSSQDNLIGAELPWWPRCGRELGRWITPFRRRIGRWLTDATPLLGLLRSPSCRFRIQTAPWALPWKPFLNLRFSHASPEQLSTAEAPGQGRTSTIRLFEGGTFDSGYNSRRSSVELTTPKGLLRAVIAAVITGHGSDENNCAEFCPTSHHFLVNGHEHVVNFTNAGTTWGCADQVLQGVEPNEHGTWQYGRNGWCDGQQVDPTVFDVTKDLASPGQSNSITYKGLFRGSDPHPRAPPGYIMMQSSLVFYLGPEGSHS